MCLTAIERRGRRPLPSGLGGPSQDPQVPLARAQLAEAMPPVLTWFTGREAEDEVALAG